MIEQNVSIACVSSPLFHFSQPLTKASINLFILSASPLTFDLLHNDYSFL